MGIIIILSVVVILIIFFLLTRKPKRKESPKPGERKIVFRGPAGIGDRLSALVCYKVICDYKGYDLIMFNTCEEDDRCYDFQSFIEFEGLEYTDDPADFDDYINHHGYISSLHCNEILKTMATPDEVYKKYIETFRKIKPTEIVKSYFPDEPLDDVYGIHLRKGDKIQSIPFFTFSQHSTSQDEFDTVIEKLLQDVKVIIETENNPKFLVVSESQSWRKEFIEKMKSLGNFTLIEVKDVPKNTHKGIESIVDFFALAQCKKLFMGIGFSVFTIAASIIGDKPLVTYMNKQCLDQYMEGGSEICKGSYIKSNLK